MSDDRPRITDDFRSGREPAESWLFGAFIVFFGVAVAAALAPISASIRVAMADAARGATAQADAEHRSSVRAQAQTLRALPAKFAGGDVFPAAEPFAHLPVDSASSLPRVVDLAAGIQTRGYHARAPPHA